MTHYRLLEITESAEPQARFFHLRASCSLLEIPSTWGEKSTLCAQSAHWVGHRLVEWYFHRILSVLAQHLSAKKLQVLDQRNVYFPIDNRVSGDTVAELSTTCWVFDWSRSPTHFVFHKRGGVPDWCLTAQVPQLNLFFRSGSGNLTGVWPFGSAASLLHNAFLEFLRKMNFQIKIWRMCKKQRPW